MGVNLIPLVSGFDIYEQNFHKRNAEAPPGSTLDGSVEDGCIIEGPHKVLRFTLRCKNIGDQPLVIGNPALRQDIFERSTVHQSGWIMKDKFNSYVLRNDNGSIKIYGHKRPFCLYGGPGFTCQNQGIAPNTLDIYGSDLACQFIVIDGLCDGEYVFEATTNATSVQAAKNNQPVLFEEDNYDDNTISVRLHIHDDLVDII